MKKVKQEKTKVPHDMGAFPLKFPHLSSPHFPWPLRTRIGCRGTSSAHPSCLHRHSGAGERQVLQEGLVWSLDCLPCWILGKPCAIARYVNCNIQSHIFLRVVIYSHDCKKKKECLWSSTESWFWGLLWWDSQLPMALLTSPADLSPLLGPWSRVFPQRPGRRRGWPPFGGTAGWIVDHWSWVHWGKMSHAWCEKLRARWPRWRCKTRGVRRNGRESSLKSLFCSTHHDHHPKRCEERLDC